MIRNLVKSDVDRLVEMGKSFWGDSFMSRSGKYPKDSVYRRLYSGFLSKEIFGWCSEKDEKIVCAAIFTICENFWTFEKQMSELAWFSDKEFLGSLDNIRIINEAERFAKENKIKFFCMARIKGMDSYSKLHKFYEKRDFFELESTYLKVL